MKQLEKLHLSLFKASERYGQLEKIIVKSFFAKRIRKRVMFELLSSQKRKDA